MATTAVVTTAVVTVVVVTNTAVTLREVGGERARLWLSALEAQRCEVPREPVRERLALPHDREQRLLSVDQRLAPSEEPRVDGIDQELLLHDEVHEERPLGRERLRSPEVGDEIGSPRRQGLRDARSPVEERARAKLHQGPAHRAQAVDLSPPVPRGPASTGLTAHGQAPFITVV